MRERLTIEQRVELIRWRAIKEEARKRYARTGDQRDANTLREAQAKIREVKNP